MRNLMLGLCGVVLVSSAAAAEPPKYARTPRLTVDVKLSSRVKPRPPAKAGPHRPALTADAVLAAQERQRPYRAGQEAILIQLIADTPDSDPAKPDYLFRLAEIYAQQLRFHRLKAVEATLPARRR